LDENVDVKLIRRFFSHNAWLLVEEVVALKKKKKVYLCKYCSQDADDLPSLACDHYLSWFHMKCLGLKKEPKYWFCRDCYASPMC